MYQEILSRPLTVGVIWDDGVVRVHPPIRRALDHLVEKLKSAGHEIIAWDPIGHADFIKIQVSTFVAFVVPNPYSHRLSRTNITRLMEARIFAATLEFATSHSCLT